MSAPAGRWRRRPAGGEGALPAGRLLLAVALVLLAAVLAAPSAGAAKRAARRAVATVVLTQLKVSGQKVAIAGRVTLPLDTAAQRARTRVAFTLTDARRTRERFAVKVDRRRAFKLTRATRLTGRLSLAARVTLGGRQSGEAVTRSLTVKAVRGPGASGGGTPTTPSGGGTTPPGGGTAPPVPVTAGATPLRGLFRLDEGRQAVSGRLSGSWFRMLGGAGFSPLPNGDSPLLDTTYTPLRPGADGGLSTVSHQPPPTPPFARRNPDGSPTGNALAARLTLPQTFFGVHFSIVTDATDPQTGQSDPLPAIAVLDGRLGGQVTAWAAQWNGQSFNQGAPKPDGSYAGLPGIVPALDRAAGTVALTGTYDAASGRYTLDWQSLIVGGPFDTYTGRWHLEGTFVPAG